MSTPGHAREWPRVVSDPTASIGRYQNAFTDCQCLPTQISAPPRPRHSRSNMGKLDPQRRPQYLQPHTAHPGRQRRSALQARQGGLDGWDVQTERWATESDEVQPAHKELSRPELDTRARPLWNMAAAALEDGWEITPKGGGGERGHRGRTVS